MSRTKMKYLKEADRYNYFADKITVSHWFEIESELVTYNGKFLRVPELNTGIRVVKLNCGLTRVSFTTCHNLNRILRYWGFSELGLARSGSDFHHDDNFIPFNLRKEFAKRGYSSSDLRKEAAAIFLRQTRKIEKDAIIRLWGGFYPAFFKIKVRRALLTTEVCYDIESVTPFEFSRDQKIIDKFNRAALMTISRIHHADGKVTIGDVQAVREHDHPSIAAKLSDKSILKVYTKETHRTIMLNRIERDLKKKQLEKSLEKRGRKFNSADEFLDLLNRLSQQTFDIITPILNVPIEFDDKSKAELVKKFCWSNYGKHGPDAFKDFTTGGCFVGTGKRGKSTSAVQRITLKLKRENGPIKKHHGVGKYVLDWHKLKSTDK